MFSKEITFQDATVKAGLGGMEITCRNLTKKMSFEEFAAWVYPLIDAEAKKEETTAT
jgi:hypothetical protein